MIYHNPKNEQEMNEIYVVLSHDGGGEGIVSCMTPAGGMPLVFGHRRNIDNIMDIINKISKDTNKTIKIYKFKKDELLQTIDFKN